MSEPTKAPAAAADQTPPESPKVQTFNLKPVETQTLVITQSSHQRTFAAMLSLLAQERMGYPVTENTQFKLNAEMTVIEICELPPQVPVAGAPEGEPTTAPASEQKPGTPPAEPKSGAVAAK